MKNNIYLFLGIVFAFISCSDSSSTPLDEPEIRYFSRLEKIDSISCQYEVLADSSFKPNIEIESFFSLQRSTNSNQGLAIWDNAVFAFHDKNQRIDIYDIETKNFISSINVPLELSENQPHCNTVNFGKSFLSQEDKYPLIYVQDGGLNNKVQVYRTVVTDTISIQKVQTISYSSCYHSATAIDSSNNILYVISLINNNRYILKLDVPSIEQKNVTIDLKNAFEAYSIKVPKVIQDTAFNGQDLFFLCGYSGEGELWEVDMKAKKAIVYDFPSHELTGEPEGIEWYNNDLIVSFSNNAVYKIKIY